MGASATMCCSLHPTSLTRPTSAASSSASAMRSMRRSQASRPLRGPKDRTTNQTGKPTMIKLSSLFLAAFAATIALAQPSRADDLIVATDTAFVPFEFKQGDKYVGFDIDMWDAIAKEIGVTYQLQPMDFNGILPALQTKQIDVGLAGITIKPERQKVIDFSDGYYDSGFMLMVRADSTIKSADDLKGKVLAVKTGTSATDYAKENFKDTELRLFPNSDNAYMELQTGRVDAAMHDTPNVLYYIATAGA